MLFQIHSHGLQACFHSSLMIHSKVYNGLIILRTQSCTLKGILFQSQMLFHTEEPNTNLDSGCTVHVMYFPIYIPQSESSQQPTFHFTFPTLNQYICGIMIAYNWSKGMEFSVLATLTHLNSTLHLGYCIYQWVWSAVWSFWRSCLWWVGGPLVPPNYTVQQNIYPTCILRWPVSKYGVEESVALQSDHKRLHLK